MSCSATCAVMAPSASSRQGAGVTFRAVSGHPRLSVNSVSSYQQSLAADVAMWRDLGWDPDVEMEALPRLVVGGGALEPERGQCPGRVQQLLLVPKLELRRPGDSRPDTQHDRAVVVREFVDEPRHLRSCTTSIATKARLDGGPLCTCTSGFRA